MKTSNLVLAATVASMFIGGSALAAKGKSKGKKSAPAAGDVKCTGVNSCKGQSACAGASNACKGQNGCGGKGWIGVKDEKECTSHGGTVVADAKPADMAKPADAAPAKPADAK